MLNIQDGWDTRIEGVAHAQVTKAAIATDGSVFLAGVGEEEGSFYGSYSSVVVHLNSSGSVLWEWKVGGVKGWARFERPYVIGESLQPETTVAIYCGCKAISAGGFQRHGA